MLTVKPQNPAGALQHTCGAMINEIIIRDYSGEKYMRMLPIETVLCCKVSFFMWKFSFTGSPRPLRAGSRCDYRWVQSPRIKRPWPYACLTDLLGQPLLVDLPPSSPRLARRIRKYPTISYLLTHISFSTLDASAK